MLHILLMILKIAGILLLLILGIILLAASSILFVPVRYKIMAAGDMDAENPVFAKIKITWFLHLLNLSFSYPEDACLKVRVFCFPVFDSSGKKEKKEKKRGKKEKNTSKEADRVETQAAKENKAEEKNAEIEEEPKTKEKAEVKTDAEPAKDDIKVEAIGKKAAEEKKKEGAEPKKSIFSRIIELLKRLFAAIKNIEYTIKRICDKIKGGIENIQYYLEVIKSRVFKNAFGISKKQLLRILRMLKPKKCEIHVIFGFEDPAVTGQVLAVYGMAYPIVGRNIFVQADFENKILKGDLYIKGKIRIFTFVMAALKLYTDKNIRELLKMLKREDA